MLHEIFRNGNNKIVYDYPKYSKKASICLQFDVQIFNIVSFKSAIAILMLKIIFKHFI